MNDREPQDEDGQAKWSPGTEYILDLVTWFILLGIGWLASFLFQWEWHLAQYLVAAAIILLAIIVVILYRRSRRLYRRWSRPG